MQQVTTFLSRDWLQVVLPEIRVDFACAMLIEPVDFLLAQHENSAQDDFRRALRVGLAVSKRQCAAPGTAEYLPFFYLQSRTQNLYVVDQVPGCIVIQVGMRCALAAATLIKQHNPIDIRIPEAAHSWRTATPRATVQEHNRLAMGITRLFIIELVTAANLKKASADGFDGRIKLSPGTFYCHGRIMRWSRPDCYEN